MGFTKDELALISIYNAGDRKETADAISGMMKYLEADENELREMAESTLKKLDTIGDKEFDELDLVPDFDV